MSSFQVELLRADLKNENHILIRGYFKDDCPCAEQLSVRVNGQSVFSEFKKNNLNEIRRDYSMHGKDVYEEYYTSIDANMPLTMVETIEVFEGEKVVFCDKNKSLQKKLLKSSFSCDAAEIKEKKTYIYGKAPHSGKLTIQVKNKPQAEITYTNDFRLKALYPELMDEEATCFEICIPEAEDKAIYDVVFSHEVNAKAEEECIKADMESLCTAVLYGARYGRIQRFKRYAKRYGFMSAVSHYLGRAKVHAAPEYRYADFIEKYYPDMISDFRCELERGFTEQVICREGYKVFCAPGMVLSSKAFEYFEKEFEAGADFIYADEDEYDGKDLNNPKFKSGFSMDYLYSCNYIGFPVAVKNSLLKECALNDICETKDEGAWYDAVLSLCESANKISHIQKILGHSLKRNFYFSDIDTVKKHIDKMKIDADVSAGIIPGSSAVHYKVSGDHLVSVIIPNKDNSDILKRCVDSLLRGSAYTNLEIIIVENNSTCEETFEYYKQVEKEDRVRVLYYPSGFNFSAINNFGIKEAKGQYLLLLNNDTELIDKNSIGQMLSICQQSDVGMVGALLYFPDDTIQHAGVAIGLQGLANHVFSGQKDIKATYLSEAAFCHDMSAVTAACLMISKKDYEEIGGFDERLTVAFNDVDLCLRIKEKQKRIVYTPYSVFYHYESKSRGHEDSIKKQRREEGEVQLCGAKHELYLAKLDPYFNKNLTRIYMNAGLRR